MAVAKSNQEMKREKRRSVRRLDTLFAEIERKEGIKALSFC